METQEPRLGASPNGDGMNRSPGGALDDMRCPVGGLRTSMGRHGRLDTPAWHGHADFAVNALDARRGGTWHGMVAWQVLPYCVGPGRMRWNFAWSSIAASPLTSLQKLIRLLLFEIVLRGKVLIVLTETRKIHTGLSTTSTHD